MENQRQYFISTKEISQSLLCKICTYVALNAVECQNCEQLYCEDCTKLFQRKKNECPDCKQQFQTKQPHRLIKEELSKLTFKCINELQGCKLQLLMGDVIKHVNECQFKIIKCVCGWNGPRSKQQQHEQTCQHFATKLCNICKEDIKLSKFQDHNCFYQLQQQIQKIQDKFYEYKETSDYSIKDLKNQASKVSNEQQGFKQQIKQLQDENNDLRRQTTELSQLIKQLDQQFKQGLQQNEQQRPFITSGKFVESKSLKCSQEHMIQYWMNPQGEQKTKKCLKCQKTQVNCRYCCPICQFFVCLKCQVPEITRNPHENVVLCPAQHKIQRKNQGFYCAVCEKNSSLSRNPGGGDCTECDFQICFDCLENQRYKGRIEQCPVQ